MKIQIYQNPSHLISYELIQLYYEKPSKISIHRRQKFFFKYYMFAPAPTIVSYQKPILDSSQISQQIILPKQTSVKSKFSPEEDELLKKLVNIHGA